MFSCDVTLKSWVNYETMKIQKPITNSSADKTKQPKPDEWKIGDIDDEEDSGRKIVCKCTIHNCHKQTTAVKNLIDDTSFSGEENFINFNEDTKTKLHESEGGNGWNSVSTSEGRLKIPKELSW